MIAVLPEWPEFRYCVPHIEAALRYNHDDLRVGDLTQNPLVRFLAPVLDEEIVGCLALEITERARSRYLSVITVGGWHMEEWIGAALEALKALGREQGCTAIEGRGRRGWDRILQRHGWTPGYVTMRYEL